MFKVEFTLGSYAEDVFLYSSFALFFVFVAAVLLFKLASTEDCYSRMNKWHKFFFLFYIVGNFLNYYLLDGNVGFPILGFIVGTFIFISLHYVYLFSLVGLSRKSISIDFLMKISFFTKYEGIAEEELLNNLISQDKGMDDVRENRLRQLLLLNWARKDSERICLTGRGRWFNSMGELVLKIWGLKRK